MVDISTFLSRFELKSWEFDFTFSIIAYSFNHISFFIFQNKTKLTSSQFTTFKFLSEIELCFNWGYRIVVKFAISWHNNIGCQDTCCRVLSDVNSHFCVHGIIVNVCICSCYFTNCISMSSFFIIWNGVKLDRSVSFILLRLDYMAIFKQFKGEGISFKRFSFQFLSEIELCCSCTWCEGVVEHCICWKGCHSC